ncbi:bone morphogenetic protein 1 homolog isoform X2 [Antedon mediterranea]|uniref:bone morphogenetic protein 1 homolog isoform X2 n=1 Tax=Antedon mediterranea TaxID=105859 RepID=UPI003AF5F76B
MRTPSVLLAGPIVFLFWCFTRICADIGIDNSRIAYDESEQATTVSCVGRDMFQGDIIPNPSPQQEGESSRQRRGLDKFLGTSRQRRAVTSFKHRYWPNAEIPYLISQMFDNKTETLIRQAISTYETHTCLRFVPRTNQTDYAFFSVGEGCCSSVGRTGGKQIVSIGTGCDTIGTILHEIGHLVGFWHEQSRPDRDEHVTINTDNMLLHDTTQFHKQSVFQINSFDQGYDYGSIMHYGAYYFTINGQKTITPNDEHEVIGQRERLSKGDILQLNIMYRCTKVGECGGTIFAMDGEIHSPNYPRPFRTDANCEWAVAGVKQNLALMLEFTDIYIPGINADGSCSNDSYIEVRDGFGKLAPLIGRYCGYVLPASIKTHSGKLWIKLHVVNQTSAFRFHANFNSVSFQYKYTEFKGDLKTPHYPLTFPRNSKIVWQISILEGFFVNLRIIELLVPESETGCRSDYLLIFDGETNTSPLITKLCRSQNNVGVVSSGNNLRLEMHSDNHVDNGVPSIFYAQYEARDMNECRINNGGCHHACMNLYGSYACGCRWGYRFTDNSSVNCTDVDECSHDDHGCPYLCVNTEGSYYCDCPEGFYKAPDGIQCIDENECDKGSPLCEHRCSNTPGGYECSCDLGYILHENNYNCIEVENCRNKYEDYEGYFFTPIIPNNNNSLDCLWHINVEQDLRISLGIEFERWENDDRCLNYITIGQGQGPGSGALTTICSIEDWPEEVDTISNSIWVQYHSEWPHTNSFLVNYFTELRGNHQQECGGTINETTTLETPGYPDFYPNKVDCIWKITGNKVSMLFENFDIEKQEDCQFDFVDIMDGDVEHPARVGRFCGSRSPPTLLRSITGEFWIKFQSDATVQGKGFRAIVNVE